MQPPQHPTVSCEPNQVLFVPTGTQGLNNFTIVEVSVAVKFFLQRQGC
jgi:hypothetical protein